MEGNPLKIAGDIVLFIQQGGIVGLLVLFFLGLYTGVLAWGKDLRKVEARAIKAEAETKIAQATIVVQTATIQHQTEVMERTMWVASHGVTSRIAQDEDIPEDEVIARMARPDRVSQNTRLNYPRKSDRRRGIGDGNRGERESG